MKKIGIVSNTTDLGVLVVRNRLIKILHDRHPKSDIFIVSDTEVLRKTESFYRRHSWVAGFFPIDRFEYESELQKKVLVRRLSDQAFDCIVLSPESGFPSWLLCESKVPMRVGLYLNEERRRALTHPVQWDTRNSLVYAHWIDVLRAYLDTFEIEDSIISRPFEPYLRFPDTKLEEFSSDEFVVAVHVGGNPQWNRRWPLDGFKRVCSRLGRTGNCSIALVGGMDEKPENEAIMEFVRRENPIARIFDYSSKNIEYIIRVLNRANLFVGNDSGPMNIAVAVGTKSILIRGADPENFRPDVVDPKHEVISAWDRCSRKLNGTNDCPLGCPVAYDRTAQSYPQCMTSIPLEKVWNSIKSNMQQKVVEQ